MTTIAVTAFEMQQCQSLAWHVGMIVEESKLGPF